jgi:Threonine aldolase
MEKINLMNDYNMTAHPSVLDAIQEASGQRFPGYGADEECDAAAEIIRKMADRSDAEVFFFVGGTQTNLTALGSFLRPHEAVVAPGSAHIFVHETGAIESAGHKVLTTDFSDGKATPESVENVVKYHTDEHMVKPKLLYISQTTELGTVYSLSELTELRQLCDKYGLYLYIDGARLGCALSSSVCDFTLKDIASLADAFYIGGTKNGLLFGEALVICNPSLAPDFRYLMKQRGGLLSKGFLLGIQFQAIFKNDLYFELAKKANTMAASLSQKLSGAGIPMLLDTITNQVFPCVSEETLGRLEEHVLFERWPAYSEQGIPIRFVTTWQTTEEEIEAVLKLL